MWEGVGGGGKERDLPKQRQGKILYEARQLQHLRFRSFTARDDFWCRLLKEPAFSKAQGPLKAMRRAYLGHSKPPPPSTCLLVGEREYIIKETREATYIIAKTKTFIVPDNYWLASCCHWFAWTAAFMPPSFPAVCVGMKMTRVLLPLDILVIVSK